MMVFLMVTTYLIAKRRNYVAANSRKPTRGEFGAAMWDAKWALAFPILLVLSIRGGLFTPSEVGAAAVIYALAVGGLAHRELTYSKVQAAFLDAVSDIGMIMLIILMSGMIGFAITFLQVPQQVSSALLAGVAQPQLVVLVVLGILFVAGLFVEATVLVLLLTPIFVPVVTAVGVDPVHFGILMMTIVTLGGMTPPVGVAMFAVCSLLDVRIGDYVREVVPFIATVVLLVLVLLYFPGLVLFLPDLVF
jgi:tripartite ATP-independent transporter DctM subunit